MVIVKYTQKTAHLFKKCLDYYTVNTTKNKNECHIWNGPYVSPGNGRAETPRMKVQIDKVRPNVSVHIFAYNSLHHCHQESPVCYKKGDEIRRDCGNLSCVNPEHMVLGNRYDTILAMKKRGTTQAGNQHAKKYSHEDIRNDYYQNKMTYKQLMEKYKISSKGTISHIINKAINAGGRRK